MLQLIHLAVNLVDAADYIYLLAIEEEHTSTLDIYKN